MSDAGDPTGALDPETAGRLRTHAERIVAAAGVPARARQDLTDELYGHLLERAAALVKENGTWTDAADRAIAALGGVDELASDLATAFHSRLWSSTIGVLLPAVAVRDDRPTVIGWMRLALVIGMVLVIVGLGLTLLRATPVHLVVMATSLLIGLAGLLLAFEGLARGQRWALWYGIAFAAQLVVFGVIGVVEAAQAGAWNLPIGGFLGAGILLGVAASWDRLREFVAGSPPIGRGLIALVIASLLAPAIAPPVLAVIPDPTQASADDLRLTLAVTCDRGDVAEPSFPVRHDVQRVMITADMAWSRGDLLPTGLDGLINPAHYGDTAGFRLLDGAMRDVIPEWVVVPDASEVIDVTSGEVAGWFGATSPSVGLLPETIGSFTVGIRPEAIRGGRTLRSTWLLVPAGDEAAWPRIEVAYAHLDRFLLLATAGCGESTVASEVRTR